MRESFIERGRRVAEEKAQARLDRITLYGEAIGNAYSELVDPSPPPEGEDWEAVDNRRRDAMALVLDNALQSEDPTQRLQALRAIVDLTQEIPEHHHREWRA